MPLIDDASFGQLGKIVLYIYTYICIHTHTHVSINTASVFTREEAKLSGKTQSAQQEAVAFPRLWGNGSNHAHPTARPRLFSRKINSQNQRVPTPTRPNLFPSAWVRLRSELPGGSFPAPGRFFFPALLGLPVPRAF